MMWQRLLGSIALLLISLVAAAQDDPVYESFAGVTIGRVFLTQSERDALDALRLAGPQDGGDESSPAATGAKSLPAAGYIIGPNGRSKIWKDGDFVESNKAPAGSMSFPGDVRIKRHAARDGADAKDPELSRTDAEQDREDEQP